MKTIHKITVPLRDLKDKIKLKFPKDSKIISTGNQRESFCIWYECDTNIEIKESKTILCHGTGHPLRVRNKDKFLGTVIFANGDLVFHFYERIK